jgi:DNA end-binding protein Ku
MAAVVWAGHLAFGLVSIPVSLYAAARAETTRFTRLQRRTRVTPQTTGVSSILKSGPSNSAADLESDSGRASAAPVEYYRVRQVLQSAADGTEVAPHELVKGYEYGPGQYVVIGQTEYEMAGVETSNTIELFHFVKCNEVDPIYFERSYYVVPELGGERAYALLLQAMQNQGCWGIARIGMHRREHILILRTTEDGIIAHTMFYAKEVRKIPEFSRDRSLVREQELTAAEALIKGYFGSFEPKKFHDIYQQRLQELIQAGLRSAPQPKTNAISLNGTILPDLMDDLKRSLKQVQEKMGPKPAKSVKPDKPRAVGKKVEAVG